MPSLNQQSSRAAKTRFHQPAIDSFNNGVGDDGESNKEESQTESSSSPSCASPNYMKPTSCSYAKKGSGTSHQASSNNSESSFDVSESDSWKPNAVSFVYGKQAADASSTRVLSLKTNNKQLRKKSTRISPFQNIADYVMPDHEGNESDRSTSGCSSSEDRELNGKIQLKKTLKKSRSSRRGSFRSSFRSPNYLKATSSSQKKMQIQASLVDSELSSLDHDKTIRNSKSSKPKSGSSRNKSMQKNLLRRTSSMRTVKILINRSTFKPKRDTEKNFSQCPHDMPAIRPTCSSTLKNSKFPGHVDLHPGESESERKSVMEVCPYSYCSLHGHQHKPPVPPLKRLLSKRRRFLKSQRAMKLRSKSSLRGKNLDDVIKELEINQLVVDGGSITQETDNAGVEVYSVEEEEGSDIFVQIYTKPRKGLSRRSSEGNEHANLDEVLFGESSYPETALEENLDQAEVLNVGDEYVPEEIFVHKQMQMDCCGTKTSSSPPSPKPGNSPITSSDEIPSSYLGPIEVESADYSHKSSIADGIPEASEENSEEEVGVNGDENDGGLTTHGPVIGEMVSAVDSEENSGATEEYKPQLQKNNRISMWHLIHQNMVSGLAEGAGTEHLPDTDKQKHGNSGSNSPASQSSGSLYYEKNNQEIQLQKMYAIKMVREAIEKILLPEVQDQLSDDQSVSSNATSEQDLLDKNNGEGGEQSMTDITIDEVSSTANEVTAVKEETKIEKRSLKNWSNLKKLILLRRFIKALEKVKTLKLREPQHIPLEPGQEAEKVSLRRGVLDSKKSSEVWMLDYALQQVVSELAPIQKRKVALLIKAFETVVSPSDEPLTPGAFPNSKDITRDGSCTKNDLERSASEVTERDTNVEKIVTSGLHNGQESVEKSYVHVEVKEKEQVHEEAPSAISECYKEDNESNTEEVVFEDLGNATGENPSITESALSNNLVQAATHITVISSVCVSAPLEERNAISEEKNEDTMLNSDSVEGSGPVRVSGDDNNSQEVRKTRFNKEKQVSMWHMIHRQMVAGLSEESNNLEKDTDEHMDDANSLVAKESSSSSPGLFALRQNTEREDDHKESQEVELRKSYAVKLVKDAIERILLPELEDQPSDDRQSVCGIMSDQELMKKNLEKGGEPSTRTLEDTAEDKSFDCDSNKVREQMLNRQGSKLPIGDIPESARQEAASDVLNKSEKQTPKGWSNLKKLILLRRFIKELEKVKKFNPRKPNFLPLLPDPEAEQVRLRSQMMDERRNAEEWMLDYALRKVVSELAPKQKRKVELLVQAFETVAPLSEESQVQVTFPKLKGISGQSSCSGCEQGELVPKDAKAEVESKNTVTFIAKIGDSSSIIGDNDSDVYVQEESLEDAKSGSSEELLNNGSGSNSELPKLNALKDVAVPFDVTRKETEYGRGVPIASCDPLEQLTPVKETTDVPETDCKTEVARPTQLDKQKYIKMWHLLCQHVVSDVDAKVETQFLDGDGECDQVESADTLKSGSCTDISGADQDGNKADDAGSQHIGFSRRSAIQLVRDAIEEILQPEIQDDSSDAQSNASDIFMEQELEEKNHRVFGALIILKPTGSAECSVGTEIEGHSPGEQREVSTMGSKFGQQKSKNWSKLKKLILLKRTIKALEKERKSNLSVPTYLPQVPELKEEKVDLKHQSADERKKAEEWMLDHALQHAVSKLTPARKRRVSMLVEAFEAVVPLPQV